MIKAIGIFDGRKTLLLGLSHKNIDRLRADGLTGYIKIDGEEIGLALDILITVGPTEREIMSSISSAIGPRTEIFKTESYKKEHPDE